MRQECKEQDPIRVGSILCYKSSSIHICNFNMYPYTHPELDSNLLIVTFWQSFTVYSDQLIHQKCIPDHWHKTSVVSVLGCEIGWLFHTLIYNMLYLGGEGEQNYQALSKQEPVGPSSSFALSPQLSALQLLF